MTAPGNSIERYVALPMIEVVVHLSESQVKCFSTARQISSHESLQSESSSTLYRAYFVSRVHGTSRGAQVT